MPFDPEYTASWYDNFGAAEWERWERSAMSRVQYEIYMHHLLSVMNLFGTIHQFLAGVLGVDAGVNEQIIGHGTLTREPPRDSAEWRFLFNVELSASRESPAAGTHLIAFARVPNSLRS